MVQYIEKAAIIAEINRVLDSYHPTEITSGRYALVDLRDFLDTLEVKEVDLNEEVKKYINDNFISVEKPDEFLTTVMQLDDMVLFAKYFYELGLNSK